MNLNKVVLIGRLAQQPATNQSKAGFTYARFNIAITRDLRATTANREREVTDFIPLVGFGNTATFVSRFFNKGDLVSVVGTIQTLQYTSKTGEPANSFSVVIDQIKSLEPLAVTQARAERHQQTAESGLAGTTQLHPPANNPAPADLEQPTFKAETLDSAEDNPWELDL